jgi:hypothetical protein
MILVEIWSYPDAAEVDIFVIAIGISVGWTVGRRVRSLRDVLRW